MGKPYDVKDVKYVKNEYEENERQISRRWWQRIIIQQHWKHFDICKRIIIDIYVLFCSTTYKCFIMYEIMFKNS